MNEFTSKGREVFALFYAKATWRCLRDGKAAEQFRPFLFLSTMKQIIMKCLFLFLFTIIGISAKAYDAIVNNIYYNINYITETAEVTSKDPVAILFGGKNYTGDITLPSTITYDGEVYRVTSIGNSAFQGCVGLTNISIPNSVTSIGNSAFQGCVGLTNISFPNSVTTIGSGAFAGCSNLESISFSNRATPIIIGKDAFLNTKWFDSKPEGLIYIEKIALIYKGIMPDNTIMKIKDGTSIINSSVFAGCTGLRSIFIPQSVIVIGNNAFEGCSGLTTVILDNTTFVSKDLPDDIKGLEGYFGNQILEYIIGSHVTSIGNNVFANCSGMTNITIPSSVTSIGNKSFVGCTGLTNITIPNSVTNICDSAFYDCSNLKSVRMGSGIKTIGYDAFTNCPKIDEVHIEDLAAWCNIDFETVAYSSRYEKMTSYDSNPIAARVVGSGIFTGGGGATIYHQGEAVSDLKIPDGVTIIKPYVFPYSNIRTVTIPSSITKICEDAFYKCTNLKGVYINDLSAWCNIDFKNYSTSLSSLEANPLMYAHDLYLNNEKITNLSVPSSVKQIKPCAFYNCSLESVILPNGLTTIGESAFSNCQNLMSIVIPNTVSTIGVDAFANCLSLYSVTSLLNMPFNLDETVFQYKGTQYDKDIVYMAATLYVPRGRVPMYSSIQGWQKFLNIVETDTKFKLTYIVDGEEYKTYEIQATEVITPEPDPYKEGCIFSGWSEIPYLMPAHDVTVTGAFTIDTAIDQIMSNGKDDAMIYTIDGKRLSKPQRGLNIVRMSDGTTRKVVVK